MQQEAGLQSGLHRDTNQVLPGSKEEKVWEMKMSLWRRQQDLEDHKGLQLADWAEKVIPGRGNCMEVGKWERNI